MKEGNILFKIITFWILRMVFFTLICIYSLFVTCTEGNYVTLNVQVALLLLILISLALACQSLYCLSLLFEKD